jgi:hypothetical protein
MQPSQRRSTTGLIARATVAVALFYAAFLFPSPEFPIFNRDDGASFMTLAINLAQHHAFSLQTTGPEHLPLHAVWPPGFPLMLAGVITVFGMSWVAIKLFMVASGLLGLYLLWQLLGDEIEGQYAVLLTALSPIYFLFSHHTMAEIPFMVLLVGALLLLNSARSPGMAFLSGILAGIAFLTRGYALTLLPTAAIYFALQPSRSVSGRLFLICAFAVPMLTATLGWWAYTEWAIASGDIDGFTQGFGSSTQLLDRLIRPPIDYLKQLYWHDLRYAIYLMVPVFSLDRVLESDGLLILSVVLLVVTSIGWVHRKRAGLRAEDIWVPLTLLLIFAKANPAVRYGLMVLPFLFYYFLVGLRIFGRFPRGEASAVRIAGSVLAVACGAGLLLHLSNPDALRFQSQSLRELRDLSAWADEHLPSQAVLASYDATATFVSSRRRAIRLSDLMKGRKSLEAKFGVQPELYAICPTNADPDPSATVNRPICSKLDGSFKLRRIRGGPRLELLRVELEPPPSNGV